MLLQGKNAVIYGGAEAIGGSVARAFAREGARVILAGRTLARLEGARLSGVGFLGNGVASATSAFRPSTRSRISPPSSHRIAPAR